MLERRTVNDESFGFPGQTDGTAVTRSAVTEYLLEEGDSSEDGVRVFATCAPCVRSVGGTRTRGICLGQLSSVVFQLRLALLLEEKARYSIVCVENDPSSISGTSSVVPC